MLEKITSFRLSPRAGSFLIFAILLAWAAFRLTEYGNLRLSIAGNDTITFVEGSQVPLFSAEMMTGRRLLTTNLIYKIFTPKDGYQILVNGSLGTSPRKFQAGFDGIVLLQTFASILGWSALTYAVASRMETSAAKILSALIIPAFAYSPQIADWDSILMSESLTFSLFALQLAILIHIVFTLYKNPNAKIAAWTVLWGVVYFFWANLRDTNNYAALVLIGLSALTLFAPTFRRNKKALGAILFGAILFVVGIVTFQQSGRSLISTINIYIGDIFPHPSRVQYMQEKFDMPIPETPQFYAWFEERGVTAATRFILAHPGCAAEKLSRDFPDAFHQGVQPYFVMPEKKVFRQLATSIGEGLHPETITPFFVVLIFLISLTFAALQGTSQTVRPWLWISAYVFLVSTIAIIPTILGDNWALHRHTIFSIAAYRFCMWLCVFIAIDLNLFAPRSNNAAK
ncbi:MAG: hypothetical protein LC099_04315 [Anaerolineales bacterium]|nr:hypothetical protein [Anaerolineales bacterium]